MKTESTMTKMKVRIRYLFGAFGLVVLIGIVFVAFAPFWRNTSQQISAQIFDSLYLFDGLWLTCMFQARRVECIEMGVGWPQAYGLTYGDIRPLMGK